MDADVVVVGGGLSGLSAAKWLSESGVSVIVLEARDRVGGRTYTKHDPRVNYVDLGGSYVGPTQHRLLRLTKELGIENYKIYTEGDYLVYRDGKGFLMKHMNPKSKPLLSYPFVSMDINNIFRLIDKMAKEIPSEAPWDAPHADEWDTMTYKEFLDKQCWTKHAKILFELLVNIALTSDSYESSLLGFLWYIKQCGGASIVFSETGGAQERKIKGGTQQISMKIAEKFGNAVVKNSPVIEINQESEDIVIVKTINGRLYKAKYVILAISPILQMKIHFSPPMPSLRNQLMQRCPMGSVIKCHIYYSKPFWKEKGLSGACTINCGGEQPIIFTMDDTKPDGSFPALTAFIVADEARKVIDLNAKDRRNLIAKSLAEATCCNEALEPVHYEEKNWMEEQYSGGCFTATYPPGFLTRYGRALRTPVDRLYFASTETAIEWSGYMEGAIEAGERAAREILHAMGRLTTDKIFQKEPSPESTSTIEVPPT